MTDFWTSYALYVGRWIALAIPGSWMLLYVQRRVRSTTAVMIVSQAILGVFVFWIDRIILRGGGDEMWIVMAVHKWESLTVSHLGGVPVEMAHDDNAPIGYIPVFEDRDSAVEWAGDEFRVVEVATVGAARG